MESKIIAFWLNFHWSLLLSVQLKKVRICSGNDLALIKRQAITLINFENKCLFYAVSPYRAQANAHTVSEIFTDIRETFFSNNVILFERKRKRYICTQCSGLVYAAITTVYPTEYAQGSRLSVFGRVIMILIMSWNNVIGTDVYVSSHYRYESFWYPNPIFCQYRRSLCFLYVYESVWDIFARFIHLIQKLYVCSLTVNKS